VKGEDHIIIYNKREEESNIHHGKFKKKRIEDFGNDDDDGEVNATGNENQRRPCFCLVLFVMIVVLRPCFLVH
jgi:hypothetical protein